MTTRPYAEQIAEGTASEGRVPMIVGGIPTWTEVPGGIDVVTNIAGLSSATTSVAWVTSVQCMWRRNATSTLTPDGITVVAATVGNWERLTLTTAPLWLYQDEWYIDPVDGDDEHTGGIASPLQSFDELNRRLSVGEIHQDVEITVVQGSISLVNLAVDCGGRGHSVTVVGQDITIVLTDAVATWAALSHVTPRANLLTAVSTTDWSTYMGRRLRFTSGTRAGAYSWICAEDPTGTAWLGSLTGGVQTGVSAGNTFVLEALDVQLSQVILSSRDGTAQFLLQDMTIGSIRAGNCSVRASRCAMYEGDYPNEVYLVSEYDNASITLESCGLLGATYPDGPVTFTATTAYGAPLYIAHRPLVTLQHYVSANSTDAIRVVAVDGPATLLLDNVQVWGGFNIYGPCNVTSAFGALSGVNPNTNEYGLLIRSDNVSFLWTDIEGSFTPPNLSGDLGEIGIDLLDTMYEASWSTCSFRDGCLRGTGTLVAGACTVTAPLANVLGVQLTRVTPGGTAIGTLCAPSADRTSTSFLVHSLDSTGSVETDDTSTFEWFIPGSGARVTVGPGRVNDRNLSV